MIELGQNLETVRFPLFCCTSRAGPCVCGWATADRATGDEIRLFIVDPGWHRGAAVHQEWELVHRPGDESRLRNDCVTKESSVRRLLRQGRFD